MTTSASTLPSSAKVLGTDTLRLWGGGKSGSDMTTRDRQDFLSLCCKAAEVAEKTDVTLCLECHKKTFTEQPDDAVWLMQSVNSRHFAMYWQPFQWKTVEDNLNYLKAISPHVENIHVFNWKQTDTFNKFPLSLAINEWVNYLKNFTPPKTLLLEFMPNDKVEDLIIETNALKQIVEGL